MLFRVGENTYHKAHKGDTKSAKKKGNSSPPCFYRYEENDVRTKVNNF